MPTRIGELLVEASILSAQQLESLRAVQSADGGRMPQLVVSMGHLSEIALAKFLSRRLIVPWISVYHIDFQRSLLNLVPRDVADRYVMIPVHLRKDRAQTSLLVLTDDPTDESALGEAAALAGMPVRAAVGPTSDVRLAIDAFYFRGIDVPDPTAPLPRLTVGRASRLSADETRSVAVSSRDVRPPGAVMAFGSPAAPPAPLADATPLPGGAIESVQATTPRSPSGPPISKPARALSGEAPGQEPELESREISLPRAPLRELTFLDGTRISIPAPARKRSDPPDDLTLRDVISALRAAAHGADPTDILGPQGRWEALVATLIGVLAKRGLVGDAEFLEELRKV